MSVHKVLSMRTPPDADIDAVGEHLLKALDMLEKEGYVVHTIAGHTAIVDGVSCTVGYNIVGIKAAKVAPPKSGIPIVVAA